MNIIPGVNNAFKFGNYLCALATLAVEQNYNIVLIFIQDPVCTSGSDGIHPVAGARTSSAVEVSFSLPWIPYFPAIYRMR